MPARVTDVGFDICRKTARSSLKALSREGSLLTATNNRPPERRSVQLCAWTVENGLAPGLPRSVGDTVPGVFGNAVFVEAVWCARAATMKLALAQRLLGGRFVEVLAEGHCGGAGLVTNLYKLGGLKGGTFLVFRFLQRGLMGGVCQDSNNGVEHCMGKLMYSTARREARTPARAARFDAIRARSGATRRCPAARA